MTTPRRDGVVLLHGISRTNRSFKKMEDAVEAAGFMTLNLAYRSRHKPLEALAADIHPAVSQFARSINGEIHFVAHSMGGLLTRVYLARYPLNQLGRVVMLGTPNGGSEVADLLKNIWVYRVYFGPAGQQLTTEPDIVRAALPVPDYPVGIIAGTSTIDPLSSAILPKPNDGRVSVQNTKLEGMSDHIELATSHPCLVRHKLAIDQTIAFLREGRFQRPIPTPGGPLASSGA